MAPTTVDTSAPSMVEDFATLLDLSMGPDGGFEGAMLKGRVIRVLDDAILVDVGLKSEGRVPLKEFGAERSTIREGDTVELVVERYEDRDGAVVLSREKALRELRWQELEQLSAKSEKVTGIVTGRVKGGFTVDLGGVSAFLPGSQVDIRVGRDVMPPMGVAQLFLVTRMDRRRANVVVSRRAVLEESRAGQREEVLRGMREGAIFQGVVKNLTDYGAFVDLGGLDGLVHISDICWRRIGHPREVLTPGQSVTVVVTRYSAETGRISLGIKQLEADPWTGVVTRFPVGTRIRGVVSHVLEYGAFVTMEPGIEGLVHVSDMSWTKKQPQGILLTGQEVEVVVLDVDETKHRISLGLRQLQANPWQAFLDAHPVGTAVEGVVRDVVEFGLFVSMGDEIDGLVHMDNISWDGRWLRSHQQLRQGGRGAGPRCSRSMSRKNASRSAYVSSLLTRRLPLSMGWLLERW